ncbi:TonB-dependent receptor [Hymenobacter persicinus]|uniref:TonB-dependent siderophore receptor n=1 Tax=Hymenobacter persicinus TaxID=2025506 RepID=A0A4Q5LD42_9BACT|nr:TonB-dependent receptor [Hymenobacter persicinus]RYU78160.1 TonB-dependent siderophore receptor [Hymenobacter persicinus]
MPRTASRLTFLLAFLLFPGLIWAQTGTGLITGKLVGSKGQPLENMSVSLKKTGMGVNTAEDGTYELRAAAGNQLLHISGLGYITQELTVDVVAGKTTSVPVTTLVVNPHQLAEVTISEGRNINQRPTSISKLPVASLDLPQSAVTVERQVLEQQQVLRLSDALVNVSGLYVTSTTGGTQEELGSRGFAYGSNNTFKNGVRFNNGVMPEASSLERMEVLKGSTAILYGNVAAGGVLNLVTKKPQLQRGGSVGLRVGSFGFWKPMVDVYGAVGKSEKVAFRLNGTYEQSNSFRDQVQAQRLYVNPSLLFELTPKTSLLLEGDFLRDNRTPDFGIGSINYEIPASRTRFLNVDGAKNETNQTSTTATLTSQLTDAWQVRGVAGFQHYDNLLLSATRPVASGAAATYGDLTRGLQRTEIDENYFLAQLDLTGKLRTGRLEHTVLLGADADQYETNTLAFTNPASAADPKKAVTAYDIINILDRNKTIKQPGERLTGFQDLVRNTNTQANTRRAGFYAQDLLSLSEKVKVLAGLRWSYQETPSDVYYYNTVANNNANVPNTTTKLAGQLVNNRRYDNAFSPRLGVVYQPLKTMAVFASYANSFQPNTGIDAAGKALAPSTFDQYEVGVKNDLFKGLLSANVTAYRIVNSNLAQTYLGQLTDADGKVTNNLNTNIKELAGEVTSKGVEVDVQSKPMMGWTIITGYSYNNTAYTKSNIYENGSRLRYNPAHTANLSLYYNFSSAFGEHTFLRGLSAGITSYYVGDKMAGRNTRKYDPATGQPFATADAFKLISIPNYTLFDASLGYAYERFSVRVKLANILNELSYNLHDDNSVNPIAPRTFSATASYRL